jgi:hypothetical protein
VPSPSVPPWSTGAGCSRDTLTGTDGSRLTLSLSGKVTVNGRGDVVIGRDIFTCA